MTKSDDTNDVNGAHTSGCRNALLIQLSCPAAADTAANDTEEAWRRHLADKGQKEGWLKPQRREFDFAKVRVRVLNE